MDRPQLIRLVDLVPHIINGTRTCIKVKFKGMNEYQDYYGSDASKLPPEILNSLCLEMFHVKLDFFPDGITPTLVIYASDEVTLVTFDPNPLFQQFGPNLEKPTEPTEAQEEDSEPTEEIE